MIEIINGEVRSSEGKLVQRIDSGATFKSGQALRGDTPDMYTEVDEMPVYSKSEYDEMVNTLIRARYSESEEFAIQRKALSVMMTPAKLSVNPDSDPEAEQAKAEKAIEEYANYNAFVEECKANAPQAIIDRRKEERMALEESIKEVDEVESDESLNSDSDGGD